MIDRDKAAKLRQMLRAMMTNQTAWTRDRGHRRVITKVNGRESFAMAIETTRLARLE